MDNDTNKIPSLDPLTMPPSGDTIEKSIDTAVLMGCVMLVILFIEAVRDGLSNDIFISFLVIAVLSYGVRVRNRTSAILLFLIALNYEYILFTYSPIAAVFFLTPLYLILQGTIGVFRHHKSLSNAL